MRRYGIDSDRRKIRAFESQADAGCGPAAKELGLRKKDAVFREGIRLISSGIPGTGRISSRQLGKGRSDL